MISSLQQSLTSLRVLSASALVLGLVACATPQPDAGEACRFVQRNRRGILGGNLKESPFGSAQAGLILEPRQKLAPQTPPTRLGGDGKGQKLGFACDGAPQKEPCIALDQKKG